MADRAELRQLIERARERGMDEAQVRVLAQRYLARNPTLRQSEPVPESVREPWMLPQSTPEGDPDPNRFERSVNPALGAVQLVGNIPKSAANAAVNMGMFLEDPAGNTLRAIPGLLDYVGGRYGSPGRALDTVIEDPVGVGMDVYGAKAVGVPPLRAAGRASANTARAAANAAPEALRAVGRHVQRNPGTYAGLATSALTGDLTGAMLGKAGDVALDWWQRRQGGSTPPAAPPVTRAETVLAEADAAGESLLDRMVRDATERERQTNPDFWSDDPPLGGPRTPPQGPQQPPGAPGGAQATSTSTQQAKAPGASEGVAEEVLKRERQSYLDREYEHLRRQREAGRQKAAPTPEDYIERGAVSERAGERLNLGDETERLRTYAEWKALEQKARAAGDIETAEYANKRARQRLHISKKEESRRAKGN